jgi:hypothetical protein
MSLGEFKIFFRPKDRQIGHFFYNMPLSLQQMPTPIHQLQALNRNSNSLSSYRQPPVSFSYIIRHLSKGKAISNNVLTLVSFAYKCGYL